MKAIQMTGYGTPSEVCQCIEVDDVGEPGPGEVVIAIEAAAINLVRFGINPGETKKLWDSGPKFLGRTLCRPVPAPFSQRVGAGGRSSLAINLWACDPTPATSMSALWLIADMFERHGEGPLLTQSRHRGE